MPLLITDTDLTEAKFLLLEEISETKHEFVKDKRTTMPGDSDLNNEIVMNIAFQLRRLLKGKGYSVYMEGMKIKIPGEARDYYPDVFAIKETTGDTKQYVTYEPQIIVQVQPKPGASMI